VEVTRVPEAKQNTPKAPDIEWKDAQFRFDGSWKPDVDGALIGPNNYQTLTNLRYKDSGLEGVNGYTKINSTPLATYTKIRTGHQLRTDKDQDSYILVHAVNSSDQGRIYVNRSTPGGTGDFDATHDFDTSGNPYFVDASSGLIGRFSDSPQGNIAYANGEETMIFGGDESRVAAVFQVDDAALAAPIDVTKQANNTLDTASNVFTIDKAGKEFALVLTTRPAQALKLYISSANASASSTTIKTWTGAGFSADLVATDGTKVATKSMAQTGTIAFSSHQDGTSKLMHFEELYLYAYLIELSAGSADINYITADFAFQSVKDVWDGVYRQPIQFQVKDDTIYYDYTLQVNESSDVNAPIGGQLDGLLDSDKIYIMFEDQAAAIRMTMLGDLVNDKSSVVSIKYWNGAAYAAVTNFVDGTIAEAGKSFSQSGLMSWTPPTDEVAKTEFGSFGYIYEFSLSGTLTGTKGSTAEVLVDICTGVPAQFEVLPFDWTALYGTRLMLGGFSQGDEGNRVDYSVANAPDAFNGFDSSDDGKQSLYFGGVESVVAADQIYNRFGASVFSMFLVLKRNETYIVIGDTPDDFTIYPVAKTIGCVAPGTLATAEIGLDLGQGITRNVAIWLSHSGPIMFDGAMLKPIDGIKKFFDPQDDDYIKFSLLKNATGWVDPNYKEYNLLIPTESGATKNNTWLVYDLRRRKWFQKDPGISQFPQTGFEIGEPDTGQRYIYGGIDNGHLVDMETGTVWGDGLGTGITQVVKTGDFFPSGNIWDETLIRKFKIFLRRLKGSSLTNILTVTYYTNTEEKAGAGVLWQDEAVGSGVNVSWQDTDAVIWDSGATATINLAVGLQRVSKVNHDTNLLGWAHAFEFTLTTTDVEKGFQPLIWGTQYRIERKDNTSSDVSTP
jgi:hypothetical protein